MADIQSGFLPDRSTIDHKFTLQQIFEKSWEYAKYIRPCSLTSRKHAAGSLVKSHGSVEGARCWRPPVTDLQVNVFLLTSMFLCRRS